MKQIPKKHFSKAILVCCIALLFGAPHYLRLYLEYGTINASHLLERTGPPNAFVQRLLDRNQGELVLFLFCMVPALLLLLFPSLWKSFLWRKRVYENKNTIVKMQLAFIFFTVIFTAVFLAFNSPLERYFAPIMPLLYILLALFYQREEAKRSLVIILTAVSFFFMVSTSFLNVARESDNAIVVPSALYYIPLLRKVYR